MAFFFFTVGIIGKREKEWSDRKKCKQCAKKETELEEKDLNERRNGKSGLEMDLIFFFFFFSLFYLLVREEGRNNFWGEEVAWKTRERGERDC